ncbi:MAG TPA: tetratricopeptide repeat protein [Geminicoccaceae bacterium]|nr:tetratricopeptide repeat protein [Geminicoccaceae bacterium]
MSPDQREYLALLAWLYLQHGEPAKALVLLRAGARLAPDDVQILKTLAYAELAVGEAGAALASVERFARAGGEAGPGSPIQLIRSKALLALGRGTEARDCFRRFVAAQREMVT